MSWLMVIRGPSVGVRYELGERTRIGRLGENEIQVADANVSRVHAEIVQDRIAYTIHDRGSKNGILVNGEEVAEKVLLPNDEIQVGHTRFLFSSDLTIRNARFSNNSVYLYPSNQQALNEALQRSSVAKLSTSEQNSIDFCLRFADLFAAPPAPLAQSAERLVAQIVTLLNADSGVLLMREPLNGEMRPVVALPVGEPVAINKMLVTTVVDKQQALLSSESIALPPMADEDMNPVPSRGNRQSSAATPDATGARTISSDILDELTSTPPPTIEPAALSTLYAPVIQQDVVTAVLVVQKKQLDYFAQRELGLLHAVSKLAAGTIEAGRVVDQLNLRTAAPAAEPGEIEAGVMNATRSLRMQEILNAARRTAESDVTVLITGETGTGKEMLARHIHLHSSRSRGPFVAINCGTVPPNQFEGELFGYEKGAFAGAARTTAGKVEAAQGGTLFIDEVAELDLTLQPKLLRFLQDKAFFRVGGTRAIDANVRIIAATNEDLAAAVRAGQFREDLWYRLNVVPFHVSPLRERREDIGQLVDFLVSRHSAKLNRRVLGANDGALALLQKYDWPGNIRELENAVERAVLLADGKILTTADFAHIEEARRRAQEQADLERKRETKPLTEVERQHIIVALKKFNYNQARAADALGLHRNTLRNKIMEYGIEIPK
ncbi:MAG: sigma 54-interacting transcriptional regulator [Candidatus Sumerlaeaceae bacterium]